MSSAAVILKGVVSKAEQTWREYHTFKYVSIVK